MQKNYFENLKMRKSLLGILGIIIIFVFCSFAVFAETPKFYFKLNSKENVSQSGYAFDFGNVLPGDKLQGAVEISLIDEVPSTFMLDMSASTFVDTKIPVEDWIEFEGGSSVEINEGGESVIKDFSINLPEDIPPGDYKQTLRAMLDKYEGQSSLTSSGTGVVVRPAVGIHVYFSIPGERTYELSFDRFTYDKDHLERGVIHLRMDYSNNGNATIYPLARFSIKDFWGNTIFEQEKDLRLCYAGTNCVDVFSVEEIEIPFFARYTVDIELFFKKSPRETSSVFVAKGKLFVNIIPWFYIILTLSILTVIVLILLYILLKRKYLMSISFIYVVKKGDSLESLCEKFDVNPKLIISVNRLKPPYFIKPGSQIFIPKKK